jgi:hypothetical protein
VNAGSGFRLGEVRGRCASSMKIPTALCAKTYIHSRIPLFGLISWTVARFLGIGILIGYWAG